MVEREGYLCYRKWKRIDHLVDESLSPMEAGVALEGLMAPTFYQLPVEAQDAVTSAARLVFSMGFLSPSCQGRSEMRLINV
jgi:hypothetical protein